MPLPFIHISLLRQVWMPHSCICWMRLPRPWRFFPPPSSSHDLNPARKGFLYGTHALIRCSETHASCLPHRQTLEKKKQQRKILGRRAAIHSNGQKSRCLKSAAGARLSSVTQCPRAELCWKLCSSMEQGQTSVTWCMRTAGQVQTQPLRRAK